METPFEIVRYLPVIMNDVVSRSRRDSVQIPVLELAQLKMIDQLWFEQLKHEQLTITFLEIVQLGINFFFLPCL